MTTKEELEILENILYWYRKTCNLLHAECDLDKTSIEDTLARLKTGEYVIKDNPKW